jgi:uncharacterized protein YecT (DUF1311 family)
MKLLYAFPIALFHVAAFSVLAQQSNKPVHSWDVLMGQPEARKAAKRLVGHCGNAQTQDVMNACFAIEFENADQQMNQNYRATLHKLDGSEQQQVRAAQRAWLRYRDLHCGAVGTLQAGGGSLEPTEVFSCKADLTKARTKEIETAYQTPQ